VLDYHNSGVRVGVWVQETCLEIFCRYSNLEENSEEKILVAFTAIDKMCSIALKILKPESYPGTPFQVKVSCPCCAHINDQPPSSQWSLADVRDCMEIVGIGHGKYERRYESNEFKQYDTTTNCINNGRTYLEPCTTCGETPLLHHLVFVKDGQSKQHMAMEVLLFKIEEEKNSKLVKQQDETIQKLLKEREEYESLKMLLKQQNQPNHHQQQQLSVNHLDKDYYEQELNGATQYQMDQENSIIGSPMSPSGYLPMPQNLSELHFAPKPPKTPPPPPPLKNSFKGVVRIGVATQIAFAKKGTYKIVEMGSGVLLEVEVDMEEENDNNNKEQKEQKEQKTKKQKIPVVITAAHVVLDEITGWTNVEYTDTKIFIGVYRTQDLASRWLFEADIQSLLCSAQINYGRKGGPKGRCSKRKKGESLVSFQARINKYNKTVNVHDISVMTLKSVIELDDEYETRNASEYNCDTNNLIPVKMTEGRVSESDGVTEREYDLKNVCVKNTIEFHSIFDDDDDDTATMTTRRRIDTALSNAYNLLHSSNNNSKYSNKYFCNSVGTLSCESNEPSKPDISSTVQLLGWPAIEYTDTSTGKLSYLYDGSIFAIEGNVIAYKDTLIMCSLNNYPGGSGGPALDRYLNVVGILSKGNDQGIAFLVPIKYGLSLILPMLKRMREFDQVTEQCQSSPISSAAALACGVSLPGLPCLMNLESTSF
jgi:hypothetical protein